jgi:TP901 family phage tail tape measure protein
MMGETFKYAAPVAGALGYSFEHTAKAIGLMANAGIKASQSGTSIRAGLTNLVKPSDQAAMAMEKYGINIKKTDGKMKSLDEVMVNLRESFSGVEESEKAAAIAAIFGKTAMSGWMAVINASEADFNKLGKATSDYTGTAEKMADIMVEDPTGYRDTWEIDFLK